MSDLLVGWTLVRTLWQQRFTSFWRLFLMASFVVGPLLLVRMGGHPFQLLNIAAPITVLLATGMIGQDLSSGVLQLLFARPVPRPLYVLSRWLAVAVAATGLSIVGVLFGVAIASTRGLALGGPEITTFALQQMLTAFSLAATMTLLSSLVPSFGDILLAWILSVLGGGLGPVGDLYHWPWLRPVGQEIQLLLAPQVDLVALLSGAPPWLALAIYAANITFCLVIAIVVTQRRELSYVSG